MLQESFKLLFKKFKNYFPPAYFSFFFFFFPFFSFCLIFSLSSFSFPLCALRSPLSFSSQCPLTELNPSKVNSEWLTMVTVSKGALTRDRFAWYWSCRSKSGNPLRLGGYGNDECELSVL